MVAKDADEDIYEGDLEESTPPPPSRNQPAAMSHGRQPQPPIEEDIYEAEDLMPPPPRGGPLPRGGKQPPTPVDEDIYEAGDNDDIPPCPVFNFLYCVTYLLTIYTKLAQPWAQIKGEGKLHAQT